MEKTKTKNITPIHQEAVKVQEFASLLSSIEVVPMEFEVDVSSQNPSVDVMREVQVSSDFKTPKFFVIPELFESVSKRLVGFEPVVASGVQGSRHGVFFGDLVFDDWSEIAVAVKPYVSPTDEVNEKRKAESECLNDFFTTTAARESGFESIVPLGFILDADGTPYSITLLDEGIDTLDTFDWTNFFDEDFDSQNMRNILTKLAFHAAILHEHGDSFHGDLAPRNAAYTMEGNVFLIDWEYGKVTSHSSGDPEEHFGRTFTDLKSMMLAMMDPTDLKHNPGIGLFESAKGPWWDAFQETFFLDYAECRRMLATQGSHHQKKLQQTSQEITMLEHMLQETMIQRLHQLGRTEKAA